MIAASDRFIAEHEARMSAGAGRLAELDRMGAKDPDPTAQHIKDLAQNVLKTYRKPKIPAGTDTIARVAEAFGFTAADLKGTSRKPDASLARHVAMYLIHMSGLSLLQTAMVMGGRDGATVLYATRKIAKMRMHHPQLDALLKELESRP